MSLRLRRALVALALVSACGVLTLVLSRVVDRGRFALPYSTLGAGPEGARAALELARAEGFDARPWAEDLGRLPSGGTLLVLGGCDHLAPRPLGRPERERLVRWIEAGGVLVVAGARDFVWDGLGVRLAARSAEDCLEAPGLLSLLEDTPEASPEPAPQPVPAPTPAAPLPEGLVKPPALGAGLAGLVALADAAPPEPVWGRPVAAPLEGLPFVGLRRPSALEVLDPARVRPLVTVDGKPVVVAVAQGAGAVVVIASGSPFQNRDLAYAGGAPLLARVLHHYASPRAPVWFDEYHVGAGAGRSMARYFGQIGAAPLVLAWLVALGLALVRRARRFGGVRPPHTPPTSASGAFVRALAGLFAAAGDGPGALALVARGGLAQIAAHHRLREPSATALAKALDDRGRRAAADAVRRLDALASRSAPTSRTPAELVRAGQTIDAAVRAACARPENDATAPPRQETP